ncbi:MAG TPA: ABC transporter substrate-binding protein [Nakamurella sp.]|jgi:peptide/nickel transport system substrate-binding protein|nr:ABC transporter substrate-binding protein [Nakamurella sp.]
MAGSSRRLARRVGAAAVSVLLVGGLALFGQAPAASADSASTLIVQGASFKNNFNPWTSYVQGDKEIITNIYPSLTYLNDKQKPAPYLADSWTTSSDGLTWTFKIHPDLKWSDGQPLTAKDAAWTLNLIMTNKTAATSNGALVAQFASVEATDDTTLVIKTKVPVADMLYLNAAGGAQPGIPIVPQHIWEKDVNDLAADSTLVVPTVGYGPWTLTDYKANQYATLTANKDFFLGGPKYDKLIYQQYNTPDAAVAALRSGQLNVALVTPAQRASLKDDKDITTYSVLGSLFLSIEINRGAATKSGKPIGDGNPLLKDPAIRQAINLGIDRDTLVQKVLDGQGVASGAFLPQQYTDDWQPEEKITFDPDKANKILDDAGYPKGADGIRTDPKSGKKLSFRLGTHSDSAQDAQVAEYFVPWMKNIGIEISLEPMSFSLLNENLAKANWDMLFDRWGSGPNPTYLLSTQTCATLPDDDGQNGNTDSFYCNPEFDRLFALQSTQVDAQQRMDTFHKMLQILYTDGNNLILFYANGLSGVTTNQVKNFMIGSTDSAGNYPPQNVFLNWRTAEPVAVESSSTNVWLIVGIIIAVVVVVGAAGTILVLRKRSTADAKE